MTLVGPPNRLRPCGSLSYLIPSKCFNTRANASPINNHYLLLLPRIQHHRLSQPRSFHSTTPHNAARSPAARRSQDVRSKPIFSSDGLMSVRAQGDLNNRLKLLTSQGPRIMISIQGQGLLDKSIDEKTFMQIAKEVLQSAYSESPSASVVQRIYHDPNVTFTIGHAISLYLSDTPLREWILSACAQAGARVPLLITANRYVNKYKASGSPPIRTAVLSQIESLAMRERDPHAMLVHAKVVGLRGRYVEALALVQEVMEAIQPTLLPPSSEDDLLVSGAEAPWETYFWLKEMQRSGGGKDADEAAEKEKVEEINHRAAMVYQHPSALVRYAGQMMQKGDLSAYEECMGKAATAGNADACRKLGNFYYLTFLGRYPRLGKEGRPVLEGNRETDMTGKPKGGDGFLSLLSFFGPRPLKEYRPLALEWYRLGYAHGCVKSGVILSILTRDEGTEDKPIVEEAFQMAAVGGSRKLASLVQQLKSRWSDKEYKPEIAEMLLDV